MQMHLLQDNDKNAISILFIFKKSPAELSKKFATAALKKWNIEKKEVYKITTHHANFTGSPQYCAL